jgi:hypothetical protein
LQIPVRFAPLPLKDVAVMTPVVLTLPLVAIVPTPVILGLPERPKEVVAKEAVLAVTTKRCCSHNTCKTCTSAYISN